jgi:hypothetical protein
MLRPIARAQPMDFISTKAQGQGLSRVVRLGLPKIHEAGGAASVGRSGWATGRSHCPRRGGAQSTVHHGRQRDKDLNGGCDR